jgi:hypothetical protein
VEEQPKSPNSNSNPLAKGEEKKSPRAVIYSEIRDQIFTLPDEDGNKTDGPFTGNFFDEIIIFDDKKK